MPTTPSQLHANITTLQEAIYRDNFDISAFFLAENEIAKLLLAARNPGMSKSNINTMVDGYPSPTASQTGSTASGLSVLTHSFVNGLTSSASTFVNGITSSVASTVNGITSSVAKFAKDNHIYPINLKEEVKRLKTNVRKAVMMMMKTQKTLLQKIITSNIQYSNAIAAAAGLVAPPTFNIPGAIVLILTVVEGIDNLVYDFTLVMQYLDPILDLVYLVSPSSFSLIVDPINAAILVLISIMNAIDVLRKLMQKLIDALIDLIKKNRKKDKNPAYDIPNAKNGEFPEEAASDFLNTINPIINKASVATQEIINYVYDVVLPDGTVLNNIDQERLDAIKEQYTVIFEDTPPDQNLV